MSVDPLTSSYPWYTPYQFAGNKPIAAIDLDGLEEKITNLELYNNDDAPVLDVDRIYIPDAFDLSYQRVNGQNPKYIYLASNINNENVFDVELAPLAQWAFDKASNRNQNYVANRFFKHWMLGRGGEYLLTENEIKDLKILSLDMTGLTKKNVPGSRNDISWEKRVESKIDVTKAYLLKKLNSIPVGSSTKVDYKITAGVETAGTLGEFSVSIIGTLLKTGNNSYIFEGTSSIYDEYDFDPRFFDLSGLRSDEGETAVRKARLYQLVTGLGDDFIITSKKRPLNISGKISDLKK